MRILKFFGLIGYKSHSIYGIFRRLKINGLLEKEHYNIEYGLHQNHINLTPEGMAMVYHLIQNGKCKKRLGDK